MNHKLSQMPFLRLLIPLAIGITLALYFPGKSQWFFYLTLLVFCLLLAYTWYENKNQNYSRRWVFGALIAIVLIGAGYSLTIFKRPYQTHSYFEKNITDSTNGFVITIASPPQEKEKTIKIVGEVSAVISGKLQTQTSGKTLLYFEKDSLTQTIKYGDVLLVKAFPESIKPPGNPDEFDYKNYLAQHGIFSEFYVRSSQYSFTGKNSSSALIAFTNKWREKLIKLLDEKIKGTEAAVASAILLGYRDDLSQQIISQFVDSGTVHVICVAGLHVGILFWLLGFLLLPIERIKHGKLIRTILLVLLLWLYALFTGLATPVIRATVMFSFLTLGRHFGRYTNNINTLAASAFLMLLFNPFQLADVGFQLSYLSVLGIITLYPMLNRLIKTRYYFVEKTWELACLSISAQMAIIPLSILYFHQFPNYFVFTNLLIVPLLSIVIYSGVLFFITTHIPVISTATAWILQKSLLLMNLLVDKAHKLPGFVSKGLSISVPEAILLYIALLLLFAFAINKKYKVLFAALCCFVVFMGIRVCNDYKHAHQQIFVVYNVPKHSAVAFISGRQCITTRPVDSLHYCYHLQNHWWNLGIKDSGSTRFADTLALSKHLYFSNNYAKFNNVVVGFVRNNDDLPAQQKIVHYLVVSGDYRLGIANLQNAFIFDKLIFDSSVSSYKLKKWKEECEQLHISYYDVNKQGAFIQNI